MYRGAEHIFLDHLVKGVALGTIVTVFQATIPAMTGLVVDHVHNDYVRGAREDGDAGRSLWHRVFGLLFTGARRSLVAEQVIFLRPSIRALLPRFIESSCTAS